MCVSSFLTMPIVPVVAMVRRCPTVPMVSLSHMVHVGFLDSYGSYSFCHSYGLSQRQSNFPFLLFLWFLRFLCPAVPVHMNPMLYGSYRSSGSDGSYDSLS